MRITISEIDTVRGKRVYTDVTTVTVSDMTESSIYYALRKAYGFSADVVHGYPSPFCVFDHRRNPRRLHAGIVSGRNPIISVVVTGVPDVHPIPAPVYTSIRCVTYGHMGGCVSLMGHR